MIVQINSFGYILSNILPILWRRRRALYAALFATSAAAFLFYSTVGERYEAYTLLRIGQGIKEKSGATAFGEGLDLTSRMDSLAKIGVTDHVLRQAALIVGPDQLFDESHATLLSRFRQKISEFNFLKKQSEVAKPEGLTQAVLGGLRGAVSVRQEGRSDLLRISFKHSNPSVVANYTNELANALVAMQADLVQVPGADVFFQQQAKRLEQETEKAAIDLQNFSVEANIYSVTDQRALLLKRVSELSTSVAATRGMIEDRKGQRQAIVDQLLVMRPVAQSKTVSSIVGRLGGQEKDKPPGGLSLNPAGNIPSFDETPPLLLVRVYQDAMASLLKINSDLNGSLRLEKLLDDELDRVNTQLADLSSKEGEYDRLKRVLARAAGAADQYGTRIIEEQTSLDIAKKAQLSSVRVVQLAESPVAPMAPNISHLVVLALLGGLAAGAGIAVMLEMAKLLQQQQSEGHLDNTLAEFVKATKRGGKGMQAAE